jgi:acyl-CoA thioesterase II
METAAKYSGPAGGAPLRCTPMPPRFELDPEPVPRPHEGWAEALLNDLALVKAAENHYSGNAPEYFGDRVFGGFVVAQAIAAATATTIDITAHSLHATFLAPVIPGPIEWRVECLRDGRSFATREVSAWQHDRLRCRAIVSFHVQEGGAEYAIPMPRVEPPESQPAMVEPGGWDIRDLGPTPQRADGTYESTSRSWRRMTDPVRAPAQQLFAAFLSDTTWSAFRPHSLGEWGTHTDASIDHAVWFHRSFDVNDWILADFEPVVNHAGRAVIRGTFFQHGQLCMSMAQELLIREL